MVTPFGQSGFKPSDHDFVGAPAPEPGVEFRAHFDRHLQRRLEKRGGGFAELFDALARVAGPKLILETGCLRVGENWAGDGQSSYLFDLFTQHEVAEGRGAAFLSIDLSLESLAAARRACSYATTLVLSDSVHALHTLARQMRGRTASLLYLDSFDVDHDDPMPSAAHHIMELVAAAPLLGPGSLVAVDDYMLDGVPGGKGLLVDRYMSSISATVIHSGYQKVWRCP